MAVRGHLFPDMREKRTEKLQTHVGPSVRHQLELFKGNVVSMSDYLHEVIEEHLALREARVRISHQKIGRRVGNQ